MKFIRWLVLALAAGIAAGASSALHTKELLDFSLVSGNVTYALIALVGLSVGLLVRGVQEGLLMVLTITLVGTITLFLAIYLPNVEIAATTPELILGSVWWGIFSIFFLTIIGMVVGQILSGE